MQQNSNSIGKIIKETSIFIEEFIKSLTGDFDKSIAKGDIDYLLDRAEEYETLDESFKFKGQVIDFNIDPNIQSLVHQNILFQEWNNKTIIKDKFTRPHIILPYLITVMKYELGIDHKEGLKLDQELIDVHNLLQHDNATLELMPWIIQKYIISSSAFGLNIKKDSVGVITVKNTQNDYLKKAIIYSLFQGRRARGNLSVLTKNIMTRKGIY